MVMGPTRIDVLNATSQVPVYFLKNKLPSVPRL